MSYDFKKLSDVTAVTEIEDGDYILTVKNGDVKKIKKSDAKFGGGAFVLTEEDCIWYWDDDGQRDYIIVADELENTLVEVAKAGAPIVFYADGSGVMTTTMQQLQSAYNEYNDSGEVCLSIFGYYSDSVCDVKREDDSTITIIEPYFAFVLPKKLADYWEMPYEDGD